MREIVEPADPPGSQKAGEVLDTRGLATSEQGGNSRRPVAPLLSLCLVTILLLSGCGTGSPSVVAPTRSITGVSTSEATPPSSTSTTVTTSATTTTTHAPAPVNLGPGSSGPAVLALQRQLTSLGYWLGTPDETFSQNTEQAVYALQKAAHLTRDGIVGPLTEAALAQGVLPHPRSTTGYVIEVDLQNDLLLFVTNGKLDAVLNTSTGGGYTYTDDGVTAVADTPTRLFHIYRQEDGMVTDSLGQLWRPKFFDDGFAIHGDSSVPPQPVSHGCVRVSDDAIDWIWAANLAPIGTTVWVY